MQLTRVTYVVVHGINFGGSLLPTFSTSYVIAFCCCVFSVVVRRWMFCASKAHAPTPFADALVKHLIIVGVVSAKAFGWEL